MRAQGGLLPGLRRGSALALVLIFALLLASCSRPKEPVLKVGSPLPALVLATTSGGQYRLPEAASGKLLVILFWSKGCQYCEREMPVLEPLYQKYRARGFELLGVHMGDDPGAVGAVVKASSLSFPMVLDKSVQSRALYGVKAVPTMFVVDREGRIVEKVLGGLPVAEIEKLLIEKL